MGPRFNMDMQQILDNLQDGMILYTINFKQSKSLEYEIHAEKERAVLYLGDN